jgi:hypothetical protein
MDVHLKVQWQTECDNIRKKDIDTFLVEIFDKLYKTNKNKTYDLFIERDQLFPFYYRNGSRKPPNFSQLKMEHF